jgi:hypothetical protein
MVNFHKLLFHQSIFVISIIVIHVDFRDVIGCHLSQVFVVSVNSCMEGGICLLS